MKKLCMFALVCILAVSLLSGCTLFLTSMPKEGPAIGKETPNPAETAPIASTPTSAPENVLPEDFPMEFTFTSGAGAWGTWMKVEKDGTFEGHFHDSNMGEIGEGYPGGRYYFCDFWGYFTNIEKVDDYAYAMQMGEITLENEVGTEWIEDGVLHIASDPYGLTDGENFILYTPAAPLSALSEEFLSWWPGRYDMDKTYETLSSYGIHNTETDDGFFSHLPM